MSINSKSENKYNINKKTLTPRERTMTVLRGGQPDKIAFITDIIPQSGTYERELRNRGMCLCAWSSSFSSNYKNIEVKSIHYKNEKLVNVIKTIYSTPFGELSEIKQPAGYTTWTHEYQFKSPDDYKKLLYKINNTISEPRYEDALKEKDKRAEDAVFLDNVGYSPLTEIIYLYMGTEVFCYEWEDNRDEILNLYKAIEQRNRRILSIVTKGPFEVVLYEYNLVPQLIGKENYLCYFKSNYEECLDILHQNGKLVAGHFDGDNTMFMNLLSETKYDIISAYDPSISPCVKEARKALPGKVLWLNFPCSWHLLPTAEIKERTIQLIKESDQGKDFIIGITETVPPERVLENFGAIMDGIDEYGSNIDRFK